MSDYPEITFRAFENISVMTTKGSFYLLIIPMLTFIFITTDILKEKEKSLRKGMMTMGLRSSAYWISWILTSQFLVISSTIMTVFWGNIFQMKFFTDTQFGITFLVFYIVSTGLQFLGFFLTTLMATVKTGNSVTYGIFLLGMVI